MTAVTPVAIGFRVKSGYAIAVALADRKAGPVPLARHIVELSDPDVKATRQPYHEGFGTEQHDAREIARRVKIVERCAQRSIASLLDTIGGAALPFDAGPPPVVLRAALVVGSVIDPQQVGNPHIRAHASEGRLFRSVVEDALRSYGIACDVIVEKQLADRAADVLRRQPAAIKRTVDSFGKTIGGPWRADEKAASTAAWMALKVKSKKAEVKSRL